MIRLPGEGVDANYSYSDLETIVASDRFQSLRPAHPARKGTYNQDALPASLSAYDIQEIAYAALELTAELEDEPFIEGDILRGCDLKSGTIIPIGEGDDKACFGIYTEEGTMAAQVMSTDLKLGLHVPDFKNLTAISQSPTQTLWEYSDARAYLMLPFSADVTVRLQEHAGDRYDLTGALRFPGMTWLAKRRAMHNLQAADINLEERDKAAAVNEMNQHRHQLKKAGNLLPLLIDIPVIDRRRTE